jgi:aspartyl-tRNA(Asn)/glutamyl-tRNA(Gln) amidotransferase subunit B
MKGSWHPYEPVIGLEVHVRLALDTKIFCDDPYSYGQEPNTLISPISLAYPGTLPRINKRAI